MNEIKLELLKNTAVITEESYDGTKLLRLHFPEITDGYLSVGHRIISLKNGTAEIPLDELANGTHRCALALMGETIELPAIEKQDGLLRTVTNASRSERAAIKFLKELSARVDSLGVDVEEMKKAVYGRKGIL